MIDIGFLDTSEWVNYDDYTLDFTYTANESIYYSETLNETFNNFSCNNGKYTIHKIDKTNLYVIFIENYNQTKDYPVNCPENELCQNVTCPGCIQDENGVCITPDSDVCSDSYSYSSNYRDACSDISFDKLRQEMLVENIYESITMCGWQGQTISPTLYPTRYPTVENGYDGYFLVNL